MILINYIQILAISTYCSLFHFYDQIPWFNTYFLHCGNYKPCEGQLPHQLINCDEVLFMSLIAKISSMWQIMNKKNVTKPTIIIKSYKSKNPISSSPPHSLPLWLSIALPASLPPRLEVFIPRQMASNTRYPPWEPHEEVLDTPGLPELQGGACAKEWTELIYT